MRGRTLLLRQEQIGRLLHTVMHEPIRVRRTHNQLEAKRFPQISIELLLRRSLDSGQRGRLRTISEARHSLQGFLGNQREPAQLADHEVDDVVCVPFRLDGLQIPVPSGIAWLEDNQVVLQELLKKLIGEERVAGRLFEYQLRQWLRRFMLTVKGVHDPRRHRVAVERAQNDVLDDGTALANHRERSHERVRRIHLVVPIRADEEQVLGLGLHQDAFDEIERGPIEPLEIVEEQGQRMLRTREDADQTADGRLKAGLRIRRRDIRYRWLLADHELQLGHQVEEQRAVRAERVTQPLPPCGELGLRLREKLPDQALESLSQRRIRHVALQLIELARREQAAWRNEHSVQLVDDRGLSDTGVATDEHKLRPGTRDGGVEGRKQGVDLSLAPV